MRKILHIIIDSQSRVSNVFTSSKFGGILSLARSCWGREIFWTNIENCSAIEPLNIHRVCEMNAPLPHTLMEFFFLEFKISLRSFAKNKYFHLHPSQCLYTTQNVYKTHLMMMMKTFSLFFFRDSRKKEEREKNRNWNSLNFYYIIDINANSEMRNNLTRWSWEKRTWNTFPTMLRSRKKISSLN